MRTCGFCLPSLQNSFIPFTPLHSFKTCFIAAESEALRKSWDETRKIVEQAATSPRSGRHLKFTEVQLSTSQSEQSEDVLGQKEGEEGQAQAAAEKTVNTNTAVQRQPENRTDGLREEPFRPAVQSQEGERKLVATSGKADQLSVEKPEVLSADTAASLVPEKSGGQPVCGERQEPASDMQYGDESIDSAKTVSETGSIHKKDAGDREVESAECCPEAKFIPAEKDELSIKEELKPRAEPTNAHQHTQTQGNPDGRNDTQRSKKDTVPHSSEPVREVDINGARGKEDLEAASSEGQEQSTGIIKRSWEVRGVPTTPLPSSVSVAEKNKLPPPAQQVQLHPAYLYHFKSKRKWLHVILLMCHCF